MRVQRKGGPWDLSSGTPLRTIATYEDCIFRMAGKGTPAVTLHGPKMGFIAAGNVLAVQTFFGAGHHLLIYVNRIVSPSRGTFSLEWWVVDFDPIDKPERPSLEAMIEHDAKVGLPGWSRAG